MYLNYKIACIVLNYNDSDQVVEFLSNTDKYELIDNIIVVDNCSTDGSFSRLKKIKSLKVSVWKSEFNGGYGYGNNFGVRIAKEKFHSDIAFICNPDVRFDQDLLKSIVKVFDSNPTVAVCSSIQINGYTNERINSLSWKTPTYFSYLASSLYIVNKLYNKNPYNYSENEATVECVPGAFLAVDVEKFLSCGGYDERVFLYCEESILGFRMKNYGYKTILLTNKNYYHFHSTSIKKSIPKEMHRHRLILNSRLFYIDNYLNVNKMKHYFAKLIFSISMIEFWIIFKIRSGHN